MKKLTRFVSVLLSALMVASMFTALNFTAFAADSKLTIRANSNIFPTQTQEFNADTNQITVTWWMQVSDANMVNTQCVITYDSSKLAVDMTDGVNSTIQDGKRVDRILRVTDGVGTVTNYAPQHTYTDLHENNPSGKFLDGESDNDASIKVNSVNLEGRELTESNGKVPFVSVTFNPKDGAQGVTNVNLYVEIMQIRGESEEEEHYFIARSEIADNKVSYMPETPSAVYAGTFDDYSVQAGDVFTVAGTANFLGTEWEAKPTVNVMTKGSDGNYTITVPSVKAVTGAVYEVKVVEFKDGDTENPIWHGVPGTGNNVDFGLKSDCDVTVTYNPSTGEIKVTGTGVTDPSYKIDYVAVVGNGKDVPSFVNGVEWDPTAESNKMTATGSVYEITYKGVAANKDLEFKFTANGAWALSWGNGAEVTPGTAMDAYYNGENFKFNYKSTKSACDLTLKLDLTNWDAKNLTGAKFTLTAKDSEEPTEAPTTKPVTTTAPTTTKPVTTTAPTTTKPSPLGDVFTLAGSSNFVDCGWEPTPDDYVMTKGGDGIYRITVPSVAAEAGAVYQVKVVEFKDGDTENPIWHGKDGGDANVDFGLKSDCDVTVTYNPTTKEIKVTGAGVTEPTYNVNYVTAVGNGYGNFLNGVNWGVNDESNRMEMVSADVYEITYEEVDSNTDLKFKFAANGTWVLNWGYTGEVIPDTPTDAHFDGADILFNYESENDYFDLTLRLDLTNWDADKRTGAKFTVTAKDCEQPTTEKPEPTTVAPTTAAPTTVAPTTVAPTTVAPTTVAPTTVAPTTVAPTTVAPTTEAPTTEPVHVHTIVVDKGYPATCTSTGLTDGSHCETCGEVIKAQEVIPMHPDTMVVKGYPATYEKDGLTDGVRCKRCGTWVVERQVIPKLIRYGDVNRDGEITIEDATLLQKFIAELVTFNEDQKRAADTNGDGQIRIDDVTEIQKYVAELIHELGPKQTSS